MTAVRYFTVPVFLVLFFGMPFAPAFADAGANPCGMTPLSSMGYYLQYRQDPEYVDGLLNLRLWLKVPAHSGNVFNIGVVGVVVFDGSCVPVTSVPDSPQVSFPEGTVSFSLRMVSPTHWVFWDDENDTALPCADCQGDVPSGTAYVSLEGEVGEEIEEKYSAVLTTPFPPTSVQAHDCCDSVLFLPGITGSRLYHPGAVLSDDRLWEPMRNSDIEQLGLNPDGSSASPDVYTKVGDVIGQIYAPLGPDIYASFLGEMGSLKDSGTIADFEAVPYDWRLSFDDILTKGAESGGRISYTTATDTPYITQELERLAAGSQTGKVTIIAHSMGGMLAKELLRRLGDAEAEKYVDRLIMVGSPQVGTPKTIASMLHGYAQEIEGGYFLDEAHARAFGLHAPSAYALLPSAAYVDSVQDPVVNLFGQFISTTQPLFDFLTGSDGRSVPVPEDTESASVLDSALLANAAALHAGIDAWEPPPGIEVDQIAGWGEDTVSGVEYYSGTRKDCGCIGPEMRPFLTEDGDGTVVEPSALFMGASAPNVKRYVLDVRAYNADSGQNASHGSLFEVPEVGDFITSRIRKEDVSDVRYISSSELAALGGNTRFRFRLHSPLTMDLYDSRGDHTGIATTSSDSDIRHIDEQIPNSYYFEMGDVKYAGAGGGEHITITLSGYATSTFNFDVDQLSGDAVVASTSFSGVPVTPETKATFTIDDSLSDASPLNVDADGDGTADTSLAPAEGETVFYQAPSDAPAPPPPVPPAPPELGEGGIIYQPPPPPPAVIATSTIATTTVSVSLAATSTSTTTAIRQIFHESKKPKPYKAPLVSQTAAVSEAMKPGWYSALTAWILGMFARIGL